MSDETRRDPRAKIVNLNVRYKSATVDDFIEDHSWDVSRGGIFIKTTTPFAQGTLLKFEIRLADNESAISGVGRVVWRREVPDASAEKPAGMGVKFIKVEDKSKAVIDKLVSQKENAGGGYQDGLLTPPPVQESNVRPTPAGGIAAVGVGSLRPPSAPPPGGSAPPPRTGSLPPRPTGKSTLMGTGSVAPPLSNKPPLGKGTMMGLGAIPSVPPPPKVSQAPEAPATLETRDAGGSFRPVDLGESSVPEESTIARQADELLISAAEHAGSDAASGLQTTNPLFASAGNASVPSAGHELSSDVVSSARPPSLRPASPMGGFLPGSEVAGRSARPSKTSPSTPTETARESNVFAPLDAIPRAAEARESLPDFRSSKRGWIYLGALVLGAVGAYAAATAFPRHSEVPGGASASATSTAAGATGSSTATGSTAVDPPVVSASASTAISATSATSVLPSASGAPSAALAPSASPANSAKPAMTSKVPAGTKPANTNGNTPPGTSTSTPAPPVSAIAPVSTSPTRPSTSESPVAKPVASEAPKPVDPPKPTVKPPVTKPAASKPDDSDNPY
ncbi:MAG: TIGR02266 family protein [Polyangiaceae bacterium]|nr:TIGR02266 family protein [Polyangiaceae bacterium]